MGGARCDSGFALIEVLVALAILSLSLTVLFQIVTDTARRMGLVETRRAAQLVAQSELAAAGTAYPIGGSSVSGIQGPFTWWMQAAPYGERGQSVAGALWSVTVGVRLRSGGPVIVSMRSLRFAHGG
jgi:prepilin-type N-terminal cleavage/methylation domain-containing protein